MPQLFSSLYSMLPQSKQYLQDGGYSPRAASYLLIGLFLAGVAGIRVLSAVLHHFIPSHVVDCDHTHDEEAPKEEHEEMLEQLTRSTIIPKAFGIVKPIPEPVHEEDEETPLTLSQHKCTSPPKVRSSMPFREWICDCTFF